MLLRKRSARDLKSRRVVPDDTGSFRQAGLIRLFSGSRSVMRDGGEPSRLAESYQGAAIFGVCATRCSLVKQLGRWGVLWYVSWRDGPRCANKSSLVDGQQAWLAVKPSVSLQGVEGYPVRSYTCIERCLRRSKPCWTTIQQGFFVDIIIHSESAK